MNSRDTVKSIKTILAATLISSIYGILEHFGIDKDIWVQDVQNRVFSTFGQPNWMAAWLVAVLPLSFVFVQRSNIKNPEQIINFIKIKNIFPYALTFIIFLTLLYTKSRSGFLGFAAANIMYWFLFTIYYPKNTLPKSKFKNLIILNLITGILIVLVGTPFTKNLSSTIKNLSQVKIPTPDILETKTQGPALEVGGSSSAEIRKIVWQGALDIWKNYPLFGSGVETFAFSYYQFRPASHNLVSEWDFLYNKAHNEYLNFMATTGTLGIAAYFILILFIIIQIIFLKIPQAPFKNIEKLSQHFLSDDMETFAFRIAFLSGFISILITNFFGFSVVPINLLFFVFPAMAITLGEKDEKQTKLNESPNNQQKTYIILTSIIACFLLVSISRYWYADVLYNKANGLGKSGNLIDSVKKINSAIKLSGKEAVFHDELASRLADIAIVYKSQENNETALRFSENAIQEINIAENLSPKNLNIIRNKARIAIILSEINPSYILEAKKSLIKGIEMAPTEAKLYQNLSLTYYRIGDVESALEILRKTIELKANYKDARFAYAIISSENGNKEEAIKQLEYILEYIDPNDTKIKNTLEELRKPEK